MEHSEVVAKIVKLLRLASSDNPHEAALAASRAQELMDRHKVESWMLDGKGEPEEDIANFSSRDDALNPGEKKTATWKWRLALALAKANAVELYVKGGPIFMVGRPSDVQTVRYLFAYCANAIEALVTKQGKGHGRTWYNNYRLGCVDAIRESLKKERERLRGEMRREAQAAHVTGAALVRVNTALAKLDERVAETRGWVKANMKLRKSYSAGSRHDPNARELGQRDGATINMGRAAIGSGPRGALKG
jgi:hypothetical protein